MDLLNNNNIIHIDYDTQSNINSLITIQRQNNTQIQTNKVRFSDTNIVISVPKIIYETPTTLNKHLMHLKTKYSNKIIKYDISIRVPQQILIENNITDLKFNTIYDDCICAYNKKYDQHYIMTLEQDYYIYEFNANIFNLENVDSFTYKIIFDQIDHTQPFFPNQIKKKVLSQNKFDIQELLEEYEDSNSLIEYLDNYTKIVFIIDLYIEDKNQLSSEHLIESN